MDFLGEEGSGDGINGGHADGIGVFDKNHRGEQGSSQFVNRYERLVKCGWGDEFSGKRDDRRSRIEGGSEFVSELPNEATEVFLLMSMGASNGFYEIEWLVVCVGISDGLNGMQDICLASSVRASESLGGLVDARVENLRDVTV